MAQDLLTLWLAALPLMGSPGPANLGSAGVGAAFGVVRGIPYCAGVIAGTASVLLAVALGVTALLLAAPELAAVLAVVAAAYVLYLAWRIATAPVGAAAHAADTSPPGFLSGYVLAVANPKAYAALGALYAGHRLLADAPVADAAAKLAALGLVIVIVNGGWLCFGSAFRAVLADPRRGRAANVVFAALLVASVAAALLNLG